MEYDMTMVQHSVEEISLLLSQIERGIHIKVIPIIPNQNHKELIHIYNIRDNKKLVKYRILRKRTSTPKEPKSGS
jgi:hypothetical protein